MVKMGAMEKMYNIERKAPLLLDVLLISAGVFCLSWLLMAVFGCDIMTLAVVENDFFCADILLCSVGRNHRLFQHDAVISIQNIRRKQK